MTYLYLELYELDLFAYTHDYRMFDDIVATSNGAPPFGQMWPR